MVESSKAVGPWRETVAAAAARQLQMTGAPMFSGPVILHADFLLRPPKTASKKRMVRGACVRPDLSKLARSTEDALVMGGVLKDDALVVELRCSKRYATDGEPTGVAINVVEAI
jgi:Holliday junction resolvase RusA-like endonuclease